MEWWRPFRGWRGFGVLRHVFGVLSRLQVQVEQLAECMQDD